MSITVDGIKFRSSKKRKGVILASALLVVQIALSFILYISFAANIIWPDRARGALGVAQVLSYEGRLTDTNGSALGGSGTAYCFRFSIYDNPTVGAGTKLWPAGTPNTTLATSTDGVFSALIGQADTLTYNFYDNDTTYLNVEVNATPTTCGGSWETLSPRQRIASAGYTIATQNVYGSLLRTDNAASLVQIGTGGGVASPIVLGLDIKNVDTDQVGGSCSTPGTVWYNSAVSKAFVCENGVIQAISNSGGTTTINALTANTATPATTGTVAFSNANGVTFGINANTITASVAAPGGGGATLSFYENIPFIGVSRSTIVSSNSWWVFPFVAPQAISASYIRFPVSAGMGASTTMGTTANTTMTARISQTFFAVIYSQGVGANSQSLQYVTSGSVGATQSWSFSANAANGSQWTLQKFMTLPNFHGTSFTNFAETHQTTLTNIAISNSWSSRATGYKLLDIPFVGSLSAGNYWMAIGESRATATNVAAATRLLSVSQGLSQYMISGANNAFALYGQATNATNATWLLNAGLWTTNAQGSTASIGQQSISSVASHNMPYFQMRLSS